MLRDLKDTAVNVATIGIVTGIGVAFLAGLGVIVARETYRDIKARRPWEKLEKLDASKWPERVRNTLLGDKS